MRAGLPCRALLALLMMNPRAGRGVGASFLQAQNAVSARLVRTAPCVCKLLFKVEMQLKYEDICLSLAASVLSCGAAALSRNGGSGVSTREFQGCGKTFPKSPARTEPLHTPVAPPAFSWESFPALGQDTQS